MFRKENNMPPVAPKVKANMIQSASLYKGLDETARETLKSYGESKVLR